MPSEKFLKNGWSSNSDGGGFAISDGSKVYGFKGFMKFKKMYKAMQDKITTEAGAIIHFRLATHGARDGSATHPFPVTKDTEGLKAESFDTDLATAHNGIISGFGSFKGGLSDTQEFIQQVLADDGVRGNIDHPGIQKLIYEATTSKWVFMKPTGKAVLVGNWIENDKVFYSNDSYCATKWAGALKTFGQHKEKYWERIADRECANELAADDEDLQEFYNTEADVPDSIDWYTCPECQRELDSIDQHLEKCPYCNLCLNCISDPCLCFTGQESIPETASIE